MSPSNSLPSERRNVVLGDSRTKKSIVLQTIQSHVSNANITESTLEAFERMEELHLCDGSTLTPSIRPAYCVVALECTLKYLQWEISVQNNPLYVNAVQKIWLDRARYMESGGSLLYSSDLKYWRDQLEAWLLDNKLCMKLAEMNTRRYAIKKVKEYLAKAGSDLGHPSQHNVLASASVEVQNETTTAILVEEMDSPTTCTKLGTSGKEMDLPKTCGEVDSLPSRPQIQEETLVKDPAESRFHLPNPKRKIVSPLKKHQPVNIKIRRKPKKWSALEEDTLKNAVEKIGEGNWKVILNSNLDIFSERTPTDLKDKWRNMTRYGDI